MLDLTPRFCLPPRFCYLVPREKPAFNKRAGKVFALGYGRLMGDPFSLQLKTRMAPKTGCR